MALVWSKIEHPGMHLAAMGYVYAAYTVRVTIFSTGSKFTELHALTQPPVLMITLLIEVIVALYWFPTDPSSQQTSPTNMFPWYQGTQTYKTTEYL